MSDLYIWTYLGGGGREVHEILKEGVSCDSFGTSELVCRKHVDMVTLTTGIMFLPFICIDFWVGGIL
jgi:hypothetical protein